MQIETYERGKFRILRIKEKGDTISDLSELKDLVTGYLDRGCKFVAVSFSDATYIYSGAIRVLIACRKMVMRSGGELCIIEPNPALFDVLELLNIEQVVKIYVSEEYLPS